MFILFPIFALLHVTAVQCCIQANPPRGLPACSNICLAGPSKTIDGVCADNFKDVCILNDGTKNYWAQFGDCLVRECTESWDRWKLVNSYYLACQSANKDYEYHYLPRELYDVWMKGPTGDPNKSTQAKEMTTEFSKTVVVITTPEEPGKASSPTPTATAKTSAAGPPSTADSRSEPQPTSATPNAQPTNDTPNKTPAASDPASTASPFHPNPDEDSKPTHIHTTIHVHGTSTSTSSADAPPLSTPKIAAISAASGLTFLALTAGATFYLLRRRRRARIVGSGESRWDPSRGMYSNEGKGFGREAKLPDVDIDAGKAVGVGVFEKDAISTSGHVGMRGGGVGEADEGAGVGQMQSKSPHEADGLETSGTVTTELETRSPTVMTMSPNSTMSISMSPPGHASSYGSERMWQMNGPSEVHAESARVVSPVVSELEGVQGAGSMDGRYYAGGR